MKNILDEIFRFIGIIVVSSIVLFMVFGFLGSTVQFISRAVITIAGLVFMFVAIFPKIIKGNKKVKKEEVD